jgi:acyl-CoA thioester hydrolase
MAVSVEIGMRVPFHDLDPLHIVWHGNYLKYFDVARFALFEAAGIDLQEYSLKHHIIFPVTRSSTKHIIPLRHKDEVICKATVTEAVYKIAIDFEIRRTGSGELCTRGSSDQVAVLLPGMEMQFEIPRDVTAALGFG